MSQKLMFALLGLLLLLCAAGGVVRAQAGTALNLTGTIEQVSKDRLTLQTSSHSVVLAITASTVIRLDGKLVMAGDLKPGMTAQVNAADGKTATEIHAYTSHTTTSQPASQPANGQTGTITQIGEGRLTLQASSHTLVFTFSSTTVFKLDGRAVGVGDVKTGMSAIVFATEGKATEVRAYPAHTTTTSQPATQPTPPVATSQTGIISQLSNDRLGIQTSEHLLSFAVTAGTTITVDGHAAAISDLKLGMSAVVLSTDGKTAKEVRASTPHATQPATPPAQPPAPNGQSGTVTQIEAGHITLQASSHSFVYALTDHTILKMDGKIVGAGDIKTGSMAIVFSTDGTTATEVRAYTPPAK